MSDLQADLDRYARGEEVTPAQVLGFAKAARQVVDLEKLDLLSGTCDVWPVCSNCSALGRFGE